MKKIASSSHCKIPLKDAPFLFIPKEIRHPEHKLHAGHKLSEIICLCCRYQGISAAVDTFHAELGHEKQEHLLSATLAVKS